MKNLKGESGFTLLEVFVSIILLLVIGAVGAPALSEYNQQFQMRSAMDRLTTEIGRARMQAMAQSAFVRIRFDGDYVIRERSLDGLDYETVGTPYHLPGGISASITSGAAITFDSTGICPSPAYIALSGSGESKVLYSNILGRVTAL
jgi:type II secretory pathway pseudopilin PulG